MRHKTITVAVFVSIVGVLLGLVSRWEAPFSAPHETSPSEPYTSATQLKSSPKPPSTPSSSSVGSVGVSPKKTPSPTHSQLKKAVKVPQPEMIQRRTMHGLRTGPNLKYEALYRPGDLPATQWYLDKISAPTAWEKSTGSSSTTVAVVDTGFALAHDELFSRWATNSGEMGSGKEANGLDDDSNGFIDDWRGWDFNHDDNNPAAGSAGEWTDSAFHGTAVAGLVGVAGDNGLGVASVNWQTRIMPLQVLDDYGDGFSDMVADAMHYAVDNGADVINLSLGVNSPDIFIEDELDYAALHGVLVVAAAGNSGCNCMSYPANYPEVLSVGATDANDKIASFSSYGSNLDVVAPGSGTIHSSTWSASGPQSDYASPLFGTSFSAPIVSGMAAMLKGEDNTLTPTEIITHIKDGADTVPEMSKPGQAIKYGSGRVNVAAALDGAVPSLIVTDPPTPTIPLYRAYKSGQADRFTPLSDKLGEWKGEGFQYEIIRFVPIIK